MSHDQSTKSPFRKVSIGTWADRKVMNLSPLEPSGQAMFIMLLIGPQTTNVPGVQPVGRMAFAEILGWEPEALDKAFREVFEQGLAKADWNARFVFVPKSIQHNLPQSPNVVKSWASTWARVPDCDLKREAWHTIFQALSALGKSFADAFKTACPLGLDDDDPKPSGKPSGKPSSKLSGKPSGKPSEEATGKTTDNQEQEKEKEQKKEIRPPKEKSPPSPPEPSQSSPPGGGSADAHADFGSVSGSITLPDWLPPEAWDRFVRMRRAMGRAAPFTPDAQRLMLTRLAAMRARGEDVVAALDQSVEHGWRGVFPVKTAKSRDAPQPQVSRHDVNAFWGQGGKGGVIKF